MATEVKMATVTIDGNAVEVPVGTILVEAAKKVARDIPVYCYHSKLGPAGLCRICLVEIEGMPKLQIACNTAVTDGMVVHTMTDKVDDGRRAVLELLLLNHPLDCPICDKGGECDLQDYSMAWGQGASRLADPKIPKPKAVDLGPTIVLDEERCIVCQRCVRFEDIITRERALRTEDRGAKTIIATATGMPYHNDFTGNVTELCPVGALTSKTYRFKSRPWDLHRTPTSCTQCSVGCRMNIDTRHGDPMRAMSDSEDDAISDGWLCDRGRYNISFYESAERITTPLYRVDGEWTQIGWDDAIALWAEALKKSGAAASGFIGGGRLLNEEQYLLARVADGLGVTNLDWRTGRQRQARSTKPGSYQDLEAAQAIVSVGRPLSQLAPVADLRVRKAVSRHGARLFSLGPHLADAKVPETNVHDVAELLAAIPESATRVAVIWDGADAQAGADVASAIAQLEARGASVHVFIPGEVSNAFGAEALGLLPRAGGRDTRAMLEAARDGAISTLAILGANPALTFPDAELVDAALAAVPFLVVSDLFLTETAQHATLFLPAHGAFEKTGTTTAMTGAVLDVDAGLAAPDGTRPDGEILIELALATKVALPMPERIVAEMREQLAAPATSALGDPALFGVARPPETSGGPFRLVIGASIFAGGGTVAHDVTVTGLRTRPMAIFHLDAFTVNPVEGYLACDLVGARGALRDLDVRFSDSVAPGTVVVFDAIPGARANVFADGDAVAVDGLRRAADNVPPAAAIQLAGARS